MGPHLPGREAGRREVFWLKALRRRPRPAARFSAGPAAGHPAAGADHARALCLGLGTMVGWKRIVVTVGEKIGKTHLSYAQGGVAELVAAGTIGLADGFGMPVSTTHVLSSGVAGTMWANKSGIQGGTVREIALAWILTLPAVILLSALIYWVATLFTG